MNRLGPRLVLLGVVAATIAGFFSVYTLRIREGSAFPAYSTHRSDARGTRALYDGLGALPKLTVMRQYRSIEDLPAEPARTIVVAGFSREEWGRLSIGQAAALDAAIRAGSRLILAFTPEHSGRPSDRPVDRPSGPGVDRPTGKEPADLKKLWGVELKARALAGEALRAPDGPTTLDRRQPTESDLYFSTGTGWRTIYWRNGEPVVTERNLGRGSIVLASDAEPLTNAALFRERRTPYLVWLIGGNGRIDFDEGHLGLMEETGIAALARRYGLSAAFFSLLVVAILFIWRRMAAFVPPPPAAPGPVAVAHDQTAGLEAVLRRAIPASDIGRACVADWRRTATPAEAARLDAAKVPKSGEPVSLYNAAVRALKIR